MTLKTIRSRKLRLAIGATALTLLGSVASADIVHPDDVIIQGSLCVGFDCVNGENFGFDTLRLKENNLRIHFDDTSVSASFPRNKWRIVANDTSNGGGSYLAFEDSTAGRQPFRVDAGARANSVRVNSAGDVGFGTGTPVVNLHVVDGNTPTLRLEQDGSAGFAAQTFDVAANEANFFVRDATNGSTLPFRIQPGAGNNMIYMANDEQIGLGTTSPEADLHIKHPDSDNFSTLRLTNPQGANENWDVRTTTAGGFAISKAGTGQVELEIGVNGNVTIPALVSCTNGIQTNASGLLSCLP